MNMTLTYCNLDALWEQFVAQIDVPARRQAIAQYNSNNRWRYAFGRICRPRLASACWRLPACLCLLASTYLGLPLPACLCLLALTCLPLPACPYLLASAYLSDLLCASASTSP